MFKIGNVEIHGKVLLAPMAGVTDYAYRKLARENGAALTYTEMTSTKGLKFNKERTLKHVDLGPNEHPLAVQIFGGDVDDYIEAAIFFDGVPEVDIIDINMGCPVPKVAIKSNAGSALMKTPEKIREIIKGIVSKISKPLTIKIRIGWNQNDQTYLQVAKIAEEEGVSAIAIHGRTREQMYKGDADWDAIKKVKDLLSIPVIGNGDVDSPEKAKKMLEYTGVDAVMIARKAQRYPFIFSQVNDFLDGGKYSDIISIAEMVQQIRKLYFSLSKNKGPELAIRRIKEISVNWLSNYPEIKQIKNNLVRASNEKQFLDILDVIDTSSSYSC